MFKKMSNLKKIIISKREGCENKKITVLQNVLNTRRNLRTSETMLCSNFMHKNSD